MNLHGIVSGVITAVNPQVFCTLKVSAGYSKGSDLTQIPTYDTFYDVPAQVQALSYSDLMQISGLNIQGTRRAVYLSGNIEGLDRAALKGGDLLIMPDMPGFPGPTTWLVAQVLEHWPNFTKVACTLQNGS